MPDEEIAELAKMNSMLEKIYQLQTEQRDLIRDIDKVVRIGNGRPALVERVALLEDGVADNEKRIDENKGFIMKALGTFGVAATGLVTAASSWFNGG